MPRPISSRMTRLRGPAWFRMVAVSTISTMKVERPRARSSAAPTRLNRRSTTPIRAARAGTKLPICASTTISAFWRRKVLLPAMLGPVSSQRRLVIAEIAIVGDERLALAPPAPPRPPDAARPRSRSRVLVDLGPHPAAAGGELGQRCGHVEPRQRRCRAPRSAPPRPAPAGAARSKISSSSASARSAAAAMRLSSSASSSVE